jgi:2-oxoisovalerate dehydrogenase E2 component (dihydrolipoyl transacylase)
MSPVIPPGTVCIGAIGRVARVPRFASSLPRGVAGAGASDDDLVAANVLNVSWAADHRVVDGATLARFSAAFKRFVEEPDTMLGELR